MISALAFIVDMFSSVVDATTTLVVVAVVDIHFLLNTHV